MSDEHKKRRLYFFILTALLAALIAYSTALEVAETENIFEIIVNNTNLAPTFAGETPGTGERVSGATYWANNSPVQLFVWAHATTSGDTAEVHLFINGTKLADTSGRPVGAAESSNKTITAIIPKFANYTIEFNNYHHYEWREYPILSGRNGTLSINQSTVNTYYNNTTSGTSNHSNLTNLNWSVAGHVMDDSIDFVSPQSIFNVTFLGYPCGDAIICSYLQFNGTSPTLTVDIGSNNGISTNTHVLVNPNNITFTKNGTEKLAINSSGNVTLNTTLDMQNNSVINSPTTRQPNNMTIVTASRVAGTVYRNNFIYPVYVSISATCSSPATVLFTVGNANPPTNNIVLSDIGANIRISGFIIVPSQYYYKFACNAGSTTIITWIEWN